MSAHEPDPPAVVDLVIEFPDDPSVPQLPDAHELHASVEADDPPDTHSISERWARLSEVGGGG